MANTRRYYSTKSAWATAQAEALRTQAEQIAAEHVPASNWHRVRNKTSAVE